MHTRLQVSHDAYLMQTADHAATFKALTATDAQAARVIEARMHRLTRLQARPPLFRALSVTLAWVKFVC